MSSTSPDTRTSAAEAASAKARGPVPPLVVAGAAPAGAQSEREYEGLRIDDLLRHSAERWPEAEALARRVSTTPGPTSFGELDARVDALALGLLDRGLEAGDRVALFADNRIEWLIADQAISRAGLVSVPRGTDTALAELDLIVEHSGARCVIVENDAAAEHFADLCEVLRLLRPRESDEDAGDSHDSASSTRVTHPSLAELEARGRELLETNEGRQLLAEAHAAVTPDSIATIVYTSGTTGRPKGVVLTHRNIVSNVHNALAVLRFPTLGRLLSILPSWHMFERIIEYVAITRGCSIVYTDQRRLKADMEHERPHIVAFVPRVWERLAAGVQAKFDKLPSWKRRLIGGLQRLGLHLARGKGKPNRALAWLHAKLSRKLLAPLWKAFGGRLMLGVSGGGALPESVDRFLLSVGVPLLNGYGLTETSPVLNVRDYRANRLRAVGPPIPETEIRIVAKDGKTCKVGQIGEIQARGPQIMRGYYRDEEATRRVIDDEGWFSTGDLGSLDQDGWLYITGRLKDTIVLATGENVEPEPIECALVSSPWIHQAMLLGQDCKVIGGLIVPDKEHVEETLGAYDADSPELRKTLRSEIDRLLISQNGFRPIDRVGPFAVIAEPFSSEQGTMTATLKLRRHVIRERYADTIRELYS